MGFEKIIPGGLGVTIFFFISGYIITNLLIDEYQHTGKLNLNLFYIRRFLRLYPALLLMIGLFYSYNIYIHKPINIHEGFACLFFYENYYFFYGSGNNSSIYRILWSLAVEEHFYLLFPLIFLVLFKTPKKMIVILVILIFIPLIFRFWGLYKYAYSTDMTERYCYVLTHTRFDSILYGCLSSLVFKVYGTKTYQAILSNKLIFTTALMVLVSCLLFRNATFRNSIRYSLQGIALFIIVPAIINMEPYARVKTILCNRIIVFIGKLSYSIYLMHMIALTSLVFIKTSGHLFLYFLAATLLTAILSLFSFYFIEMPFNKLRIKFRPNNHYI